MSAAPSTKQLKAMESAIAPYVVEGDESRTKSLTRYATKWVKYKLGVRSAKPPTEGLDAETRTAIKTSLDESLSLPAKPKAKAKAKAAR